MQTINKYMKFGNEHTERNFFRSLPDAISRRKAKALLISILNAVATWRTGSSGIWNSGMCGRLLNEQMEEMRTD